MDTQQLATLSARVDRLEAECQRLNRRARLWRILGLGSLVGVVLMTAIGARTTGVEKVVEAEKFILRDATGKVRAQLANGSKGAAGLYLYDEEGKMRAVLGTQMEQASLQIMGKDQKPRMTLMTQADNTPLLSLINPQDKSGATLILLPGGNPGLAMQDKEGVHRLALGVGDANGPFVSLNDAKNQKRAGLQALGADGAVKLVIIDGSGKKFVLTDDDGNVMKLPSR